jgi:hypothetical protein
MTIPENKSFSMDMLTEWTQCDCQILRSTGNLKEGKNEVVLEELGKMGIYSRE